MTFDRLRAMRDSLVRWWNHDPLGSLLVILCLAGIAFVAVMGSAIVLADSAHGAEREPAWLDRLDSDGTCVFDGPIAPGIVTADCLTGLYFGQPIAAQVETGEAHVVGWLVSIRPGIVTIALANVAPMTLTPHVVVRVSLATPAPAHPCEIPPPELMTMRDRCIQDACAAGIEPICLVKTSEPGTGMPGSD